MSKQSKQDELIKFDSRLLETNLSRGILTKEELEKHIKSLPDLNDQAVPVSFEETLKNALN